LAAIGASFSSATSHTRGLKFEKFEFPCRILFLPTMCPVISQVLHVRAHNLCFDDFSPIVPLSLTLPYNRTESDDMSTHVTIVFVTGRVETKATYVCARMLSSVVSYHEKSFLIFLR
jgi:hypothetical protein